MAITRADFTNLTDDLQSIFNEASRRAIQRTKFAELFGIKDETRRTHDHLILHGMPGIEAISEGQDLPKVSTDEGDTITLTQAWYGKQFEVTKTMRKFDLYGQITKMPQEIVKSSWDRIDQAAADVILNGFSTAAYTDVFGRSVTPTGPDALALFSASHTNGLSTSSATYTNLITNDAGTTNPALDRAPIVTARRQAMVHTDPETIMRSINLHALIVAPRNEDLAERIVLSSQMSGTTDNDTNPLKGKVSSIIVWPRLETRGSDSSDTSNNWFMADIEGTKEETLQWIFTHRPLLDSSTADPDSLNWKFNIDAFMSYGFWYQAYLWGSTGAN